MFALVMTVPLEKVDSLLLYAANMGETNVKNAILTFDLITTQPHLVVFRIHALVNLATPFQMDNATFTTQINVPAVTMDII